MFRHYRLGMNTVLALGVLLVFSGEAKGEVRFQIKPHKTTIVLGEPLIVSTFVKNLTNQSTDVFYQNSSPVAVIRLSEEAPPALDDLGTLYRWFRNTWSDEFRPGIRRNPPTLRLDAGEEVTFKLVVLYRRTEGFAFEHPGEYWVSARIVVVAPERESPPNYDIAAKPVAITVREPAGHARATWDGGDYEFDATQLAQIRSSDALSSH